MKILNRLKVKAKLAILLTISALSLVATMLFGGTYLHHKIVADRHEQTKYLADVGRSVVQSWYEKERSHSLTRERAQAGAREAMRSLRYGNNDYYFIQRYDGVTVLNANRPELEGKYRWNDLDPDGVPLVRLEAQAGKNGGGYVYYRFQRNGGKEPVQKVSYVEGFDPWEWAIGTGVYLDDIEQAFWAAFMRLALIASGIFTMATICAYFVNSDISSSLARLKAKMEKLAAGDLTVDIAEAERGDEIGDMAKAMHVFKENAAAAQLLEAEKEKRRELELAVRHAGRVDALGRLAGGIAHDLNNALVPVLALTKTAMSRVTKGSREYGNLELVLMGAERARDLVRQILAFSRKQTVQHQEFDLAQVVTDSIRMLRAGLPTMIKLVSEIQPVPTIYGDPGQLNQVLVNLVTNGAQAIGDRAGTVTISLLAEDASIRLTVSDTGGGMDEQTKARMFEPFFTTKEVGKGTGLGLSVVHGIITSHGGTIEVRSKLGESTQIDVLLPVAGLREAKVAYLRRR